MREWIPIITMYGFIHPFPTGRATQFWWKFLVVWKFWGKTSLCQKIWEIFGLFGNFGEKPPCVRKFGKILGCFVPPSKPNPKTWFWGAQFFKPMTLEILHGLGRVGWWCFTDVNQGIHHHRFTDSPPSKSNPPFERNRFCIEFSTHLNKQI